MSGMACGLAAYAFIWEYRRGREVIRFGEEIIRYLKAETENQKDSAGEQLEARLHHGV